MKYIDLYLFHYILSRDISMYTEQLSSFWVLYMDNFFMNIIRHTCYCAVLLHCPWFWMNWISRTINKCSRHIINHVCTNLCFMYNTMRNIIAIIHPIRATARMLTNVPSIPLTAEQLFANCVWYYKNNRTVVIKG